MVTQRSQLTTPQNARGSYSGSDIAAVASSLDELSDSKHDAGDSRISNETDSDRRTPLHEIRAVRDDIANALRRVRDMRVATGTRERFSADFEAIDAALVGLYREERFGERKAYYDVVIAAETNASERVCLDTPERPYANGRSRAASASRTGRRDR